MSSRSMPSAPGTEPAIAPPPRVPRIVPGRQRKPGRTIYWLLGLAAVAVVAVVGYLAMRSPGQRQSAQAGPTIRTAPVALGDLNRTIRITGTVQAEQFASIMAPRLRGSRSGRGRDAGNANTTVTMPSSRSGGSGGGSVSASTSSDPDSGGSPAPAAATGSSTPAVGSAESSQNANVSSLGAKRGTQNRFGSAKSSSAASGGFRNASGSVGSASLGSTSGSLLGGGGGGGGHANDFSTVLLKVADPGSHVKKGDVVAEFDRQYMLLRLDDYRASISQLDANIKKLKADQAVALESYTQIIRSAKSDMDKALLDLKTIEVRSAIEAESYKLAAEEAQTRYKEVLGEQKLYQESLRAQLRAAEIDRDQAKLELQRAENNANRMIIKSPIDGIVVMQSIFRAGEFGQVKEGDQVYPGQPFMSIVDPRSMVINATVNQVDSEKLRIGMKAMARLDAYPDLRIPGTVFGIGAMTRAAGWRPSFMREIPVRIKLETVDPRVIPDLSASAEVLLDTEQQTLIAPLASVFHDQRGGAPFVFLRGPGGWVRKEVELGLASNTTVAIRSGLEKGDLVAVQRP